MPTPSTPGPDPIITEAPPSTVASEHAFRCGAIGETHLKRFVAVLLRELFERDGARYDAVYMAYAESGIQPLPAIQCEGAHYDTRVEAVNRIADALVGALFADRSIQEALERVTSTVLDRFTVPAPAEHLTMAELREFVACGGHGDGTHIGDYGVYYAWHAHLGMCAMCDVRMRLMQGKAAPLSRASRTINRELKEKTNVAEPPPIPTS